ncbi:uncharacterized protein B0T23DRAFT_149243 [Neurospora hispaniola]|uniref:Secreted protein n=1 Tax=Neurospora hispaniola TaxID=588809 RepID=A0AAJ0I894_9PEZI|nr:hypothetical protein B0T23DRAFT_149243 [Neurospora hispaniola]
MQIAFRRFIVLVVLCERWHLIPPTPRTGGTCPGRTRIPSSILQLPFPLSIGRVSRAPVLLAQMHIQTQKAHVLVSLIRSCHHNAASVNSKFPKRVVYGNNRLLEASQQPFLAACARRFLSVFSFFVFVLGARTLSPL